MNHDKIVLFDGVCNLCSGSVQFIIRRDRVGKFKFASLQSSRGRELCAANGIDPDDLSTMVYLDTSTACTQSDAVLRIARELSFPARLASIFLIVPRFIRDPCYMFVAKRRYNWFGKKETCWLPSPEIAGRFLDQEAGA
jgi:predicted DCC family thiol-disulfide oxidoreductase YuxK